MTAVTHILHRVVSHQWCSRGLLVHEGTEPCSRGGSNAVGERWGSRSPQHCNHLQVFWIDTSIISVRMEWWWRRQAEGFPPPTPSDSPVSNLLPPFFFLLICLDCMLLRGQKGRYKLMGRPDYSSQQSAEPTLSGKGIGVFGDITKGWPPSIDLSLVTFSFWSFFFHLLFAGESTIIKCVFIAFEY